MRRRKVNKEKLTAGGGGYPDSFHRVIWWLHTFTYVFQF